MAFEFIEVERNERVTTIRINRPEVMNAIHPPAAKELDETFNDFSEDPDQWIAVLTGAGEKAFCAGNDLKYQAQHGPEKVLQETAGLKGGFGGLHARFDCFKPIIGAVNGLALGGGFELVMCCDIVVAAEHATFGLPEPKVGMMAGAGGVHRLPRQIGFRTAMGMIMTGHRITAQEAFEMGLVNEVVPLDKLEDAAGRWISEILQCAPLSVRASKEAILKGLDTGLEEAVNTIHPGMKTMFSSEDIVEGVCAFVEKRPPVWKGK